MVLRSNRNPIPYLRRSASPGTLEATGFSPTRTLRHHFRHQKPARRVRVDGCLSFAQVHTPQAVSTAMHAGNISPVRLRHPLPHFPVSYKVVEACLCTAYGAYHSRLHVYERGAVLLNEHRSCLGTRPSLLVPGSVGRQVITRRRRVKQAGGRLGVLYSRKSLVLARVHSLGTGIMAGNGEGLHLSLFQSFRLAAGTACRFAGEKECQGPQHWSRYAVFPTVDWLFRQCCLPCPGLAAPYEIFSQGCARSVGEISCKPRV